MYLLDTNIISARINNNQRVINEWRGRRISGIHLSMSAISDYEIKRGLVAVNATRKLQVFETIRQDLRVLLLDTQEIFDKAVDIHVMLRRKGRPIPDADILIAATALIHDLILVSDDGHFQYIDGLTVENWVTE